MLKRIMVYDDSPAMIKLFYRILSKECFDVLLSDSRMTCFEIEQLQLDLIILGYIRGYLDNELDILRQMRQNVCVAQIPVILCTTGAKHLQNREEIISDSRLMVVSKPFTIAELLLSVNLLLNKRLYDSFNLEEAVTRV